MKIPIVTMLLCLSTQLYGQPFEMDVVTPRNFVDVPPPKVLLVRLPTHTKRINHYKKSGQGNAVTLAQMDVANVMKHMTADFKKHFEFCPVYFFMDTNDNKIRNKIFDGVLLDNEFNPVSSSVMPPDTNFFIGYYGKYVPKAALNRKRGREKADALIQNNNLRTIEHMVLLDHQFRDIPKEYISRIKPEPFPEINYNSKRNITYKSTAAETNAKLSQFYSNRKRD